MLSKNNHLKIAGIYQISSIRLPGRLYVGSAFNINSRWVNHRKSLMTNSHRNKRLQGHYNKYGENDLQFSIIEQCDQLDLINREQYYLDLLKPSFNICKKAGSPLGIKWSEESKRKMSERQKGRKLSDEHKRKIGIGSIGHRLSEDAKRRIGEASHKRTHSIETKMKISRAKKGQTSWIKGKHQSCEVKQKLRLANIGKKQSIETINKRRESNYGFKHSDETKQRMRKPKSDLHKLHIKESWVLRKLKQ